MKLSGVIAGIRYLARIAREAKKPLVINVSLGHQQHPHNGTALVSKAVDEVSGPGVVVCCSAGNEGSTLIRAGADVSRAETTIPCNYGFYRNYDAFNVYGWYSGEGEIEIAFEAPSGKRTQFLGPVSNDKPFLSEELDGWDSDLYHMVDPRNGDHYIGVRATPPQNVEKKRWFWKLVLRGKQDSVLSVTRVDVWCIGDVYLVGPGARTTMTVCAPADADSAIAAGAYITRKKWTDINRLDWQYSSYTENGMAPFSSQGPRRDHVAKPDVVAPGAVIVSCLSSTVAEKPDSEDTLTPPTSSAAARASPPRSSPGSRPCCCRRTPSSTRPRSGASSPIEREALSSTTRMSGDQGSSTSARCDRTADFRKGTTMKIHWLSGSALTPGYLDGSDTIRIASADLGSSASPTPTTYQKESGYPSWGHPTVAMNIPVYDSEYNRVYCGDFNNPGVREFNPSDAKYLGNVLIPHQGFYYSVSCVAMAFGANQPSDLKGRLYAARSDVSRPAWDMEEKLILMIAKPDNKENLRSKNKTAPATWRIRIGKETYIPDMALTSDGKMLYLLIYNAQWTGTEAIARCEVPSNKRSTEEGDLDRGVEAPELLTGVVRYSSVDNPCWITISGDDKYAMVTRSKPTKGTESQTATLLNLSKGEQRTVTLPSGAMSFGKPVFAGKMCYFFLNENNEQNNLGHFRKIAAVDVTKPTATPVVLSNTAKEESVLGYGVNAKGDKLYVLRMTYVDENNWPRLQIYTDEYDALNPSTTPTKTWTHSPGPKASKFGEGFLCDWFGKFYMPYFQ